MNKEKFDWEDLVCDWCGEVFGYVSGPDSFGVCARMYHMKEICSKCREKKNGEMKEEC